MSYYSDNPLGEPIFFTPPEHVPFGRRFFGRRLFKGGGGGGGQREATEEERRLWSAQAQSLESMNAVAMPNLVTGMNNLGVMANESMDGTLSSRLRGMAGADASAAIGQGLSGAMQKMDRFGSTMNPNAMGAIMARAGLDGAAIKSNAMNQANVAAEDTKWNRNAALTGLASGQGAQAVNGMGSLAGQITANRNNENNMNMQAQQGRGNAVAGLLMGGKMTGLYKDGGRVREPRFSGGGMARFGISSMPKIAPYSFQDSGKKPAPDGGIAPIIADVGTAAMGANMLAGGLDKIGISAPKQAIDGLVAAGKNALGLGKGAAAASGSGVSGGLSTGLASAATEAGAATAPGMTGALGSGISGGLETGLASAASSAGAELGAAAGAAEGAAAAGGLGSMAMAAAPWLIGGYAIGSMLDLWADGGRIKRKDMTQGGKVSGPGTGTSDSVPVRVSDGEAVVNTRAMAMDKAETMAVVKKWQKDGGGADDLVLAINDRGLEKRHGKARAKMNPRYEGGEQKLSMGGIAQALGEGLFRAAPLMNQIDQQKRMEAHWAKQDARADAAEARAAATHGIQMQDHADKKAREAKIAGIMSGFSERMKQMGGAVQALRDGTLSSRDFAASVAPQYSQFINDGKTLQAQADGSFTLTDGKNATRLSVDDAVNYLASPEMAAKAYRQLYTELATIDPAYAKEAVSLIGKEWDAYYKNRDFERQLRRDAVSDSQFDRKMAMEARQHAASQGLGWARFNLDKAEKAEKRELEKAKIAAAEGIFRQHNPEATEADLAAVRTGIVSAIPKEAKNEFTFIRDAQGMGGTLVNKDTGELRDIDEKGNIKYTLPGGGASDRPAARRPPTKEAIKFLQEHPENAAQFDAKFGKGAAEKVLGVQ